MSTVPSRFIDFECNCCVDNACESFCISFFAIYSAFMCMFITFAIYYQYQKKKGCAGSRPLAKSNDQTTDTGTCFKVHYFDQILLFIILELASRMIFLSTGFVARNRGKYSVSYNTQTYLQTLPFLFAALCIITLCKYKTKIYFGFKKQ